MGKVKVNRNRSKSMGIHYIRNLYCSTLLDGRFLILMEKLKLLEDVRCMSSFPANIPRRTLTYLNQIIESVNVYFDNYLEEELNCALDNIIIINDLFHSKTRILRLEVSSTIKKSSLSTNNEYRIQCIFALSLDRVLILFSRSYGAPWYLALGEIDFERSSVVIKQEVYATDETGSIFHWFPQSYPPNLHEGIILKKKKSFEKYLYFIVKMKADGQLQVSQLEVPSFNYFGCFDGFLYSIAYKNGYDSQKMKAQPIDLVKVSISSGEQVRERTFNWKVIKEYGFMRSIESAFYTCCVGQKLFLNYSSPHAKEGLLSLDLDTRKWKLNFALNDYECMYSNGDQALIVARYQEYYDCSDIYRYVFNHPDKLSDLVWLRLKRIFDARPEAYEFILSQLPSNFKQKCPFPQL